MITRRKIAMLAAEFLGVALLTVVVLTVSRTVGSPYFTAIGAGLVVAMATLVLGSVSGAHLNPLVTIGMWSVRRINTLPAIAYVAVQLLGGIAAYTLFSYLIDLSWNNSTADFESRVFVAEAVGGFVFSLGVAAAMYHRMEAGRAAAVIGLSLTLGVIVASAGSNGLVNPAVALGAHSWVWGTYVLGPILGGIIGFNLYGLLFATPGELASKSDKIPPVAPTKAKK